MQEGSRSFERSAGTGATAETRAAGASGSDESDRLFRNGTGIRGMDARSSLTVAALSVALREHRACAMADAEARVRSAEQRAERIRELVIQETLECIERLEGQGRVSPLLIEPVLLWVQRELRRLDELFPFRQQMDRPVPSGDQIWQ